MKWFDHPSSRFFHVKPFILPVLGAVVASVLTSMAMHHVRTPDVHKHVKIAGLTREELLERFLRYEKCQDSLTPSGAHEIIMSDTCLRVAGLSMYRVCTHLPDGGIRCQEVLP